MNILIFLKTVIKKETEKIHELRYGQFRGEHMHIEENRLVIFFKDHYLKKLRKNLNKMLHFCKKFISR